MRLIDAEDLMNELPGLWKDYADQDPKITTGIAIASMPTIDPIRHGHWISTCDLKGLSYPAKCSVCKCVADFGAYGYCPNCGAKMDEVTK